MRPLLEDHSDRKYQKEFDHMNSNAEMVQLKEVNTSIINKEEKPKEKFSKREDVQNLSETNYLNESTQTAGRKIWIMVQFTNQKDWVSNTTLCQEYSIKRESDDKVLPKESGTGQKYQI